MEINARTRRTLTLRIKGGGTDARGRVREGDVVGP